MYKKYIDLIIFLGTEVLFFIRHSPLKFMSGNEWWSTKVGAKFLSDIVIFSRLSSDIPLDFHDSIPVVLVKHLMCFKAGISTT